MDSFVKREKEKSRWIHVMSTGDHTVTSRDKWLSFLSLLSLYIMQGVN